MTRRRLVGQIALMGGAAVATVLLGSILVLPILSDPSGARLRHAKARADVRALASAVATYAERMDRLPVVLDDLTVASTNASGRTREPVLGEVPTPPAGWSGYHYAAYRDGSFVISATGDGLTVRAPER